MKQLNESAKQIMLDANRQQNNNGKKYVVTEQGNNNNINNNNNNNNTQPSLEMNRENIENNNNNNNQQKNEINVEYEVKKIGHWANCCKTVVVCGSIIGTCLACLSGQ